MNKQLEAKCHADWRRSEAYCVPVNEEGMKYAEERYHQFKKGWEYGLRRALFEMEQMHRKHKHEHKFYLFMANELRGLLKGDSYEKQTKTTV